MTTHPSGVVIPCDDGPEGPYYRRQMPRFVVLYHDTPPDYERGPHFDLMIESGSALRTWELPRWPAAGQPAIATQLADHRLAYLDYEGPISGGRGHVTRHEAGSCEVIRETSQALELRLDGQRLKGTLTLRRVSPDEPQWEAAWKADSLSDA